MVTMATGYILIYPCSYHGDGIYLKYRIAGNFWREKFSEISEISLDFRKYISETCFMALLKYLTVKQNPTTKTYLPDASDPLAITMPSGSITATNSNVVKMLEKQQKQVETKKPHQANTEYICQKREQR